MRLMEPRDVPRLVQLNAEQNRRDGTLYPLPRMFRPDGRPDDNIAMALSVERRGRLRQGIYFQSKIAEMCFAGADRGATEWARGETGVFYALKIMGYEGIRCLIPHAHAEQLSPLMEEAGFRPTNPTFASFYREL